MYLGGNSLKSDNHLHSPFCPHGSSDQFEAYILRALDLGLNQITFTEHAPLPSGFIDPTPNQDSGMNPAFLTSYFQELQAIKKCYSQKIDIKIGLEVDFIEGYEQEIKHFLDENGPYLDDSILSVHFIKHGNQWYCIDFSAEIFGQIAKTLGSVENVYRLYYDTLAMSIAADLGKYKPERIGHITLAQKFQKQYPVSENFDQQIYRILEQIKQKGYSLDYNAAGLSKPLCLEPYPPERFAKRASALGIPLVFGSDAHVAKDVGRGFESLLQAK